MVGYTPYSILSLFQLVEGCVPWGIQGEIYPNIIIWDICLTLSLCLCFSVPVSPSPTHTHTRTQDLTHSHTCQASIVSQNSISSLS